MAISLHDTLVLAVYIFAFLAGLPANLLAFYTFLGKVRKKPTPIDILLFNLTVSDVILLLFLPFKMVEAASGMAWPLPAFLCPLTGFCYYSSIYISTLFLTAISVERYLGVAYPIKYKLNRRPAYAVAASFFFWLLACSHCSIVYIVQYRMPGLNETNQMSNSSNNSNCYEEFTDNQLDSLQHPLWLPSWVSVLYVTGVGNTLGPSSPVSSALSGISSTGLGAGGAPSPAVGETCSRCCPRLKLRGHSMCRGSLPPAVDHLQPLPHGWFWLSDPVGKGRLLVQENLGLWACSFAHCSIVYITEFQRDNYSLPSNHSSVCYDNFTKEQLSILLPVRLELGVVLFLVPSLITCFCYFGFIRIVISSPHICRSKKQRAVGLVAATLSVFIICFSPYNVSHVVGFIQWENPEWRDQALLPSTFNASLDPIIFYFSSSAVQRTTTGLLAPCSRDPELVMDDCCLMPAFFCLNR
uniref:Free fatty acid receptor 1 n=1 Tax=Varanus komodoensis TaxID=61221 RepID=A0A8D2J930_VARKO